MKPTRLATFTVLSALVLVAAFGSSAYGITGNFSANSYPYIGVVVLFEDVARQIPIGYSTGFLISPTVMLTAGHSCVNVAAVSVCFDKGPISYTIENGKIIYSTSEPIYNGIPKAFPEYTSSLRNSAGSQAFSTSDIGVIVLDKPVDGITTFPALPDAGFIKSLPVETGLTINGYGAQYQTTPKSNDIQNSWGGSLSCNSAQANLLSINFEGSDKYIRCSANPGQGKGGVAFGDSGGPVLLKMTDEKEIVLAVNAYVNNANCAGVTYHTRVDDPQMLSWINSFLA